MKVHQICVENINSLSGKWLIDLDDPRILQEGIFAIVGPTGSGKSTLLDAICLALYGQTPRLGRLTAAHNEAMTRGAGSCFSELEFSVKNVRYRARWSQSRARKQAGGALQAPQHSLVDSEEGRILEDKLSLTRELVEAVTGLDFERFTLTMMLAQGGFAKFLQAKEDERGVLLEKITGTAIYRALSIRSHDRASAEERKIEEIRAKCEGLSTFSEEELKNQQDARQAGEERQGQLDEVLTGIRQQINILNEIARVSKLFITQTQRKEAAELAMKGFAYKGSLLESSERAYLILPSLQRWEEKLGAMQDHRKQQEVCLEKLASSSEQEKVSLSAFTLKTEQKTEMEYFLAERRKKITKVKGMDALLIPLNDAKLRAEKSHSEIVTYCRNHKILLDETCAKLSIQETRIGKWQSSLDQLAFYLTLNEKFAGIEAHMLSWRSEQEAKDKLIERKRAINDALVKARSAHSILQKSLESAEREIAQVQEKCEELNAKLRAGWRYLNASLPMKEEHRQLAQTAARLSQEAWMAKQKNVQQSHVIEDYNKARDLLDAGHECPLCGSKEHPFMAEGIPKPMSRKEVEEAEKAWASMQKKLVDCEKEIQGLKVYLDAWRGALAVESDASRSCVVVSVEAMISSFAEQRKMLARQEALQQGYQRKRDEAKDAEGEIQGMVKDMEGVSLQISEKELSLKDLNLLVIKDFREFHEDIHHLEEADEALACLKVKMSEIKDLQEKMSQAKEDQAALVAKTEVLKDSLKQALFDEINRKSEKEQREKDYQIQWTQRQELYGDAHPQSEEDSLNKQEKAFLCSFQQEKEALDKLRLLVNGCVVEAKGLEERVSKELPLLELAEQEWVEARSDALFESDDIYRTSLLEKVHHGELKAESLRLHKEQEESARDWGTLKLQYEECLAKQAEDASLEDLERKRAEREKERADLLREIGAIRERLQRDDSQRQQRLSLLHDLSTQKEKSRVWLRLKELIGSNDGKRFSVFAQGLTLDVLLYYANQQLKLLSPRYQLVRDEEKKLDLLVCDRELGWETRSCTNLSGGESFLVSLALALGLSHLASENIRVDSLFLDEGFGTLDAQSLDVALDALSSLRRDGKTIGVISHVEALKNRIPAQISIIAGINGRSSLEGVGISRILG